MALIPVSVRNLLGSLVASPGKETSRLRVDQANTAFWEGREFRFEYEVSERIVFKFSSPIDFILQLQNLASHDGSATLTVWSPDQGAIAGSFNIPANIKSNNGMDSAPIYARQISITSGGDFTPLAGLSLNDAREYVKVKSASATAQSSTVGGTAVRERGLKAGDYYLVLTGVEASYRLVFEERP